MVLSAARHNQAAFETTGPGDRPVGSLSLALSRALPRLRKGHTYRALFDEVALQMSAMELYDQRPQIEGSVDAEVFTGRIVELYVFVAIVFFVICFFASWAVKRLQARYSISR